LISLQNVVLLEQGTDYEQPVYGEIQKDCTKSKGAVALSN